MDIALAVEKIMPAANYSGSVTANTPDSWEAVIWGENYHPVTKARISKPAWEDLEAAWKVVQIDMIASEFMTRIQVRLDSFAHTLTYDNITTASTYATSSIAAYRIEGQYCVDVRDKTWAKAYELLQELRPKAEETGIVPTWEEIEEQLPPLVWPEGSRGYVKPE